MSVEIVSRINEELPSTSILSGDEISEHYLSDYSGMSAALPLAVVKPNSTEDIARLLRICNQLGVPLVTQGGMTGIVASALPTAECIALSLENLSGIEEIDEKSGTITVLAGTPLSLIQEAAENAGFLFPLDIGSRDSCQIGGNIATNAGGNRVVKYGMTRGLVLGLEVVLADGTVISNLNKMLKNNTGYDLKQLFIGAEGTLGVITRAVLKLSPLPRSCCTALCALDNFEACVQLLHRANEYLPGGASSFELMWSSFYKTMTECVDYLDSPLATDYPLYLILECMGQDPEQDQLTFENFLGDCLEQELIVDAVIAKSNTDTRSIWAVRDSVVEFSRLFPQYVGFDVSVPIKLMEEFVDSVNRQLEDSWPELTRLFFGHIGDSNLHIIIDISGRDPGLKKQVNDLVYAQVRQLGGSISAEHGIGLSKLEYLGHTVSPEEIELMKKIKQAIDPKAILNPGKIF